MTGWVPIVSDIVDSSLWEEDDYVVKVFLSMMAKKDHNFICHGDVYTVAKWSNKTDKVEEVVKALKILSSPDKRKPLVKQEYEGRRIEEVEGGWLILNGAKYRKKVTEFKERERKRKWAEDNRKRVGKKTKHYFDGVNNGMVEPETGNALPGDDEWNDTPDPMKPLS